MWNPEDYAKNSDAQLKWARSLIQNISLNDYPSILDLGCGDGRITADFAASCPNNCIVGVDRSEEMVAYAIEKYPPTLYPNLSFICQDGRSLNFKPEFNLVFSNATLHWIDNHQEVLKGVNSSLKAGGRLIISCGGAVNAAQILRTFAQLITTDSWKRYFTN
ncbi:MAG: class I SAM-dependent methyltransferase [Cyanobacteria bacterium P01_G01_bin.39]